MPPKPGHRLHLNESPEDLPAEVKATAIERLATMDWSRYPEAVGRFRQALSDSDGWPTNGILLGNGSNELLQVLFLATLRFGGKDLK